jgi:hypothetical protein
VTRPANIVVAAGVAFVFWAPWAGYLITATVSSLVLAMRRTR